MKAMEKLHIKKQKLPLLPSIFRSVQKRNPFYNGQYRKTMIGNRATILACCIGILIILCRQKNYSPGLGWNRAMHLFTQCVLIYGAKTKSQKDEKIWNARSV